MENALLILQSLLIPFLLVICLALFQSVAYVLILKAGRFAFYVTAFFGVFIHELSHALMAVIFRHKVLKIDFFNPSPDGTLGSVSHAYNPRNIYHVIGNFFIGMAPLIGGVATIYAMTRLLLPESASVFALVVDNKHALESSNSLVELFKLSSLIAQDLMLLLREQYMSAPINVLVWGYLTGSVALQMTPSSTDFKGSFVSGCLILIVLSLICYFPIGKSLVIANIQVAIGLSSVYLLCIALTILITLWLLAIYILTSLFRRQV